MNLADQIYHIIYFTKNLLNDNYYVGKHSTHNLDDGYLGSGKALQNAIRKYGKQNFKREILYYCLTEDEAYQIEAQIVDKSFIERKNTYNICCGGIFKGNRRGIKFSATDNFRKIRSQMTSGQANPCSKTNMSAEKQIERTQKSSATRIAKGIAKGQSNNGSKTNMSEEKRHLKSQKSAVTAHYKTWILTSPAGKVYTYFTSCWKNEYNKGIKHPLEIEHNISWQLLCKNLGNIVTKVPKSKFNNTLGWKLEN